MKNKTFYFGSGSDLNSWGNLWECEAKDLDSAIKRFKLEILFPEAYVDPEFLETNEYGGVIKERNEKTGRYNVIPKEGAIIKVTSVSPWYVKELKQDPKYAKYQKDTPDPVFECELILSECINVNYNDILPKQFLLNGLKDEGVVEHENKLPVIGNYHSLRNSNKIQMREMTDEINRRHYELEQQKKVLDQSLNLLRSELQQKLRGLYILETFLGVNEEILQIASGKNAPDELPLSIYQQLLYMDEEYGAWKNQGLDWKKLEEFDAWIVKHIDKFIYKSKGVVAFRVRRYDKTYAFGPQSGFYNVIMNAPNKYTYFVIRNGENIYRIFSDISVSARLFPTLTEYQKIIEEYKDRTEMNTGRPAAEIKVELAHESYMYGFIAIQGIIERTPIFPGMRGKTNLLTGNTTNIDLIRDDEKDFWLKDHHLDWHDFADKNRDTIKTGTRIILNIDRYGGREENRDRFTGGNPGWYNVPSGGIYIVTDTRKEHPDNFYHYNYKILYQPCDTIYTHYYDQGHERKRRVGLLLYTSEVLNFDEITIADCDYYMQNRNYRSNYLSILPLLAKIKKNKLFEYERETPLVELILNKMHLDPVYEIEVRQTILWWKTKNKWKRNVMANDNVVRMVCKRLQEIL